MDYIYWQGVIPDESCRSCMVARESHFWNKLAKLRDERTNRIMSDLIDSFRVTMSYRQYVHLCGKRGIRNIWFEETTP